MFTYSATKCFGVLSQCFQHVQRNANNPLKMFPLRTFQYDPRSQRVYTCITNKFDCKQYLPKIVKTLSKNLTKYKI